MGYPRTVTWLVLHPDQPTPESREFRLTSMHDELAQVQAVVGGYAESITVSTDTVLLFGEDSKNRGEPVNGLATFIGQRLGMHPADYIAGTALLVGYTPDGETTDCDAWPPAIPH